MITRLLFITDIHYGNDTYRDIDNKDGLSNNQSNVRNQKLLGAVTRLTPNYVILGGDIYHKSDKNEETIKQFKDFLSSVKKLVGSETNIVIVPGNHDFNDANENITNEVTTNFVKPDKNSVDMNIFLEEINKWFGTKAPLFHNPAYPCVIDRKKRIIIYTFDSNKTEEILQGKKRAAKAKTNKRRQIAEITDNALNEFTKIVDIIKENTPDFSTYLFITVFHHHLSSIANFTEKKQYESIINAGQLKKVLSDNGVKLVLHGHKHWPEVYWDSAISDNGLLTVISGGTIHCDPHPNNKHSSGFHIIDFDSSNFDTVKIKYQPLIEPISLDNFDIIRLYSENKFKTFNKKSVDILSDIFLPVQKRMIELFGQKNWKGLDQLIQKSSNKQRPTMFGTAIAITILGSIEYRNLGSHREKVDKLSKSLLDLAYSDHKFGKGGVAFLEGNCWAAKAFLALNDEANFCETVKALINLYKDQKRYINVRNDYQKIFSLSFVLDVLVDYLKIYSSPSKFDKTILNIAEEIYTVLMKNSKCETEFETRHWEGAYNLSEIVHTAHALIACKKYNDCKKQHREWKLSDSTSAKNFLQIKKWLILNFNKEALRDTSDIIYAPGLESNRLEYYYYTLAIGLRALLECGLTVNDEIILNGFEKLYNEFDKDFGLWKQPDRGDLFNLYRTNDAILAIKNMMNKSLFIAHKNNLK